MQSITNYIASLLIKWDEFFYKSHLSVICIALLTYTAGLDVSQRHEVPEPKSKPFEISGYLPSYSFGNFDFENARYLDEVIFFSIETDREGKLRKLPKTKYLRQLLSAKKKNDIRYILCVGGGARSYGFSDFTKSKKKREKFINRLLVYCRDYGFSGIDLDWEFPKNTIEFSNYSQLIIEACDIFHKYRLKVSVAVNGSQRLHRQALQKLDKINLMAYDDLGKHATFERSVQYVEDLIRKGADPHKVILGIPFYAKHVKTRKVMLYKNLKKKYNPNGDVNEINGYYFNGPKMIRRKVSYAKSMGLGGIMVWELGLDDSHLLKVIADEARLNEL